MKKVISFAVAMALLVCMCGAALAAPQTGETKLTATIESSYILTIPSETAIDYGSTSTTLASTLKVTGNVAAGKKVTVTAETSPMTCADQDTTIPFQLLNGKKAFTGETWTDAELRAAKAKEVTLTIQIAGADWEAAKAGEYSGTITFSAELN